MAHDTSVARGLVLPLFFALPLVVLAADYAFVTGLNRIFAEAHDRPVDHHLLNVRYEGLPFANLVGYGSPGSSGSPAN